MILRPASGIPQYQPTDIIGSADTVDETLNILADATHDSITADRGRLTSLEGRMNAADIAAINASTWCTLSSGWTWASGKNPVIRRIGSRIEYTVFLERSSDISHGASALTVAAAFAPIANSEWYGSGVFANTGGGGTVAGVCLLNTARSLLAMVPPTGKGAMYMSGFYHMV